MAVARQRELFVRLGIDAFADRRIGGLSMGMKQKVSIARTMIHDPEVVVFDEPTVGLDIITSRGIIDLIRECRDTGKTVLFSTHLMGEVNQLGDDIAILHRGKLLHNGPFDVFRDSMVASSLEDEFLRVLDDAEANENEKETTS
jgi:sodium transport system ATP-binding protein